MSRRETINLRLEAVVIYIYCFCLFRDSLYQTSSDWITVTECMLTDASKEDVGKPVNRLLLSQTPPCSYFLLLFQHKRETMRLWTQSQTTQENKWIAGPQPNKIILMLWSHASCGNPFAGLNCRAPAGKGTAAQHNRGRKNDGVSFTGGLLGSHLPAFVVTWAPPAVMNSTFPR